MIDLLVSVLLKLWTWPASKSGAQWLEIEFFASLTNAKGINVAGEARKRNGQAEQFALGRVILPTLVADGLMVF
jgi:hypothetical protein